MNKKGSDLNIDFFFAKHFELLPFHFHSALLWNKEVWGQQAQKLGLSGNQGFMFWL